MSLRVLKPPSLSPTRLFRPFLSSNPLQRHLFSSTPITMSPAAAEQMRAVLIKDGKGPASNLYLDKVDKPVPKAGQVLVKIVAFGLNRMDLLQREGKYPLPPQASKDILGVEFSGTIEDAGQQSEGAEQEAGKASVDRWSKGDEVFGLAYGGAYAEYIAVSDKMIMHKPKHLSHEEAAGIPENFLTAFQALKLVGNLQEGESVLVHAGAGGVGVAANQLARVFGAKHVFTTAGSDEKIKFLEGLPDGPTKGINYRTQDFAEIIKSDTSGKGVDVILDFIGKDYFSQNLASLAFDGRLVLLAAMSGPKVPELNLMDILFRRLTIKGTTLRARSEEYQGELLSRFENEALPRIKEGDVEVRIYKVFDWEQVKEAHEMMEANKNSGKIVLTIS